MTQGQTLVLVFAILAIVTGVCVWAGWRGGRARNRLSEDIKKSVDDLVTAELSREGTRIVQMTDRQSVDEFEKNFGKPE